MQGCVKQGTRQTWQGSMEHGLAAYRTCDCSGFPSTGNPLSVLSTAARHAPAAQPPDMRLASASPCPYLMLPLLPPPPALVYDSRGRRRPGVRRPGVMACELLLGRTHARPQPSLLRLRLGLLNPRSPRGRDQRHGAALTSGAPASLAA